MSSFPRRNILRAGIVALANFVKGEPLPKEEEAATRHTIFDAHLYIPSDNGEVFQWNLITRTMPEFVAYLDKCGVRRGVRSKNSNDSSSIGWAMLVR